VKTLELFEERQKNPFQRTVVTQIVLKTALCISRELVANKNLLENISKGANEKHYFWKLQDILKVFTQNHYLNTEH
jgi:hypothetical protein